VQCRSQKHHHDTIKTERDNVHVAWRCQTRRCLGTACVTMLTVFYVVFCPVA
jgi:hypothetical protein